ncbi:MAG: cell division protein FtsZ [Candidatus Woesearchaeota archaeon]
MDEFTIDVPDDSQYQQKKKEEENRKTDSEYNDEQDNYDYSPEPKPFEPLKNQYAQESNQMRYSKPIARREDEFKPEPDIKFNNRPEQRTEKKPRERTDTDEELEEYLALQRATIKVVGTGGGGNNTIDRIKDVGIAGVEAIAINTDAQDLLFTNADKKILIGKEVTRGLGAGSNPKIGEEAAKENEHEIKRVLTGADMVFITCGLGGGTGTGSAPVIAEIGKKLGALTVGVVTLPFTMEGNRRYQNAIIGLEKLETILDTLIVIPNDKLLELAPDLPINTAFKVADEILTNAVKGIAELVTKAGLVNLDFADIRAVMGDGGVALIGVGESDSENRAVEAVEKALNNPLLDADISGATGALINVAGGSDMTLDEARRVVETVSERLNNDATIIWGAQIYEDLQNTIRTMLIITGVQSSQIFGKTRTTMGKQKENIENELGIQFID